MQYISYSFLLIGLFISGIIYPQAPSTLHHSGFVAPLDIPLLLSSNYGEYRSGHFHAGIDFKTQQVEGKNIFAVDTGTVYRIVVLAGGYGKAIYIKHPSGLITLYAHLSRFEKGVEKYVKEQQYRKKSFAVDLYPEPGRFNFRKGGFIGLSGNSGTSFGAHLHFEVRDPSGAIPLNPLHFGFKVLDRTRPGINWLMVYPMDTSSSVNNVNIPTPFKVIESDRGFSVIPDTIKVNGNIGIGIETYDYLDNAPNPCGPNTIELTVDNNRIFLCRLDSIPFSAAGYINSYYDYSEMLQTGKKIQKLYIDANNKLNIYKVALNRGILNFEDSYAHAVKITVTDTYGNESVLRFNLKSEPPADKIIKPAPDQFIVSRFFYDSLNVYENQNIRIALPGEALFENVDFRYAESENDSFSYSLVHKVHHRFTPLLNPYILSIRPKNLPSSLYSKALIASRGKNGKWLSQGGEYKNGFVTARLRSFGDFIVIVDSILPEIKPVVFASRGRYKNGDTISFTIADSLSGISSYAGYIDKSWALFEYDAKNNLLYYQVDRDKIISGKLHDLEIVVTDNKGNIARFGSSFYF